jgi:glyoxylase-like metal-dependent hydrolase (beta-lactamase superfamily II)
MTMRAGRWRSTFRVGDRRVLGVSDGIFTMAADFMNVPGYQHRFDDETGSAALPIASFVVEGDQTVLIDAGLGPVDLGYLAGGALLGELAAVGVRPENVDVIVISHLHLDHVGWLGTRNGEVVFPDAVVHVTGE